MNIFKMISAWWAKKEPTPDEKLQETLNFLLEKVPAVAIKYRDITRPIQISNGSLAGDTEATTYINNNAEDVIPIKVDVYKVLRKRDFLAPVLAHEIFHAYDATCKFGVDEFIFLANHERQQPWDKRTVEISAIEQEDTVRRYLLKEFENLFAGMATSRELQNIRSARFRTIAQNPESIRVDNFEAIMIED